jgi:hypothetical protein
VGVLGAATAIFAALTTRVQSDVKSSLAYASLTQVGIIVLEIAIGWYTIAFLHLAGHACFRLLQFLSAPNVLHDLHGMEDAIGDRPSHAGLSRNGDNTAGATPHLFRCARTADSIIDRVGGSLHTTGHQLTSGSLALQRRHTGAARGRSRKARTGMVTRSCSPAHGFVALVIGASFVRLDVERPGGWRLCAAAMATLVVSVSPTLRAISIRTSALLDPTAKRSFASCPLGRLAIWQVCGC